jgi:glycosyltransferase involved in cell wall biosynthesis
MATEQPLSGFDMSQVRSPRNCPHRSKRPDGSTCCRLIQRLAESQSDEECRVELDACLACCQMAEPTKWQPNSVVASLAHAILHERLWTTTDADDAVVTAERLVWIEQFLDEATSLALRTSADAERANSPHPAKRNPWWRKLFALEPRIGIVGFNNRKGLGHLNRDLVRRLRIQDWLLTGAWDDEYLAAKRMARRVELLGEHSINETIGRFLSSIDVMLFAETPVLSQLPELARRRGIPVVCVPMWERLHPELNWLRHVDLMLCPTEFTRQLMVDWQRRFGFEWRVECCAWPIDAAAFPFRVRAECRRFVYINGTDLGYPRDRSGRATQTRRKGLETLIAAARRLPQIPFLVWSQVDNLPDLPSNIELRMSAIENLDLYRDGDVCVQLSRWEGLGLPLLECQAAGVPLITTDAPPMNEHNPLAVVPVAEREVLELWPRRWVATPRLNVDDVVRVLLTWYGRDISEYSRNARTFVEQTHSWATFRTSLRTWLRELTEPIGSR